jgi:ABC-type glycerol-3-phosphate transport system substrate-binding protein
VYSFPALRENMAAVYPQKAWINADWLAKAGLSMPTTTEQLTAALRTFKTLDANGNGIIDEVPLGAAYADAGQSTLGFLIQPFVATDFDLSDGNYLNIADGNVHTGATAEGFRDALGYLHMLYGEGLMDKTVFTQGADALRAGCYGVIFSQNITALLGAESAAVYAPLPPLAHNGRRSTLVRRAPIKTGGFLIPARISPARRKRALAMGDFLLGPEGTRLVLCEGSAAVYSALRGEVPFWETVSDEATETWYAPVGDLCIGNALPVLALAPERAAELSKANTFRRVIDTMTGYARAFVTGEKSLETHWGAYLAALEKAGLRKVIEYTQEAYDNR